jgi:hypothetical protein
MGEEGQSEQVYRVNRYTEESGIRAGGAGIMGVGGAR